MIFGNEAKPLMDEFVIAKEVEVLAANSLLTYLKGNEKKEEVLESLTTEMIRTHHAAMDIWDRLQAFRIDPPSAG